MKSKLILLFLVILFLTTRLYFIGSIPGSVYWDEASIGYNAYSILKTGRDEWGEFLPLHFRAFGEFKLPVYIYSTIPFIYVFGLNEVSVRLPSVFYSLFSLIIIYFLVKKLTGNNSVSFLSCFLFVALPWNFIFSRTGYEASAGLFFFLVFISVWFYFNPLVLDKNRKFKSLFWWLLFLFSFVLSFYSYNSFRFWSPVVFLFLVAQMFITKRKLFIGNLPLIILSFFFIIVSFYPVFRLYKFDYGFSRYEAVGLTGSFFEKTSTFFKNYFSHFSFDFLFAKGDLNIRSQIPGFGQVFIVSFPFLIIGLWRLLKNKNFNLWFLLFLFLISPIPSSITKESPHALRSVLFAFVLPVVLSLGIVEFVGFWGRLKKWVLGLVLISYFSFFVLYFLKFVNNYNYLACSHWQCEYKKIFKNKSSLIEKSGKVVVSESLAQPYIFALFYNKFDPLEFRKSVLYNPPDRWGFSTVYSFDKFVFKIPEESDIKYADLIFSERELPELNIYLFDKIEISDKSSVFWVYSR